MSATTPLVTVVLLTYNRVERLKVAVAAVLAQNYPAFELFISDNHSTDGTEAYCQNLAATHSQVYYRRHAQNIGASANFSSSQTLGQGAYYLCLADDDWIELDYIANCVTFLEQHPDYGWATGQTCYTHTDQTTHIGPMQPIQHTTPSARVVNYYTSPHVHDNVIFYGVARRNIIHQLRLRNRLFGDLFLIAQAAFHGNMMILDNTRIHRQHGMSRNLASLCKTLGIAQWWGRHPTVAFAVGIMQDILGKTPAYQTLSYPQRLALTVRCLRPVLAYGWRKSIIYATVQRLQQYGRGIWRRLGLNPK